MKRPAALAIALGVLALGAAVALVQVRCGGAPEDVETPAAQRPTVRPSASARGDTPPPRGALSVRGRVLDARNQPAAGIEVSATKGMPGESLSLLPCDSENPEVALSSFDCPGESEDRVLALIEQGRGGLPVLATAVTGADGTFVLDGLPEGTVELWALSPKGAALEPGVEAGTLGVELILTEGLPFEGRVVDESGAPLPGAQVTVFNVSHSRYFETSTGAEGGFELGPLPIGDYSLVASSPGLIPAFLAVVDTGDLDPIVLHAPRRLTGRVLAGGKPAPGAKVRVDSTPHAAVTDDQGRFAIAPIPPGDYSVMAEGHGQHAVAYVSISEEEPGTDVTLHLGAAVFVEGTVRDEAGQPIAGAWVSAITIEDVEDVASSVDSTSEEDGHYRIGPLALGTYTFDVDAEGYEDLSGQEVKVSAPGAPVDFVLRRAITIEGVITTADGQPLANVELEAVAKQPRPRPGRKPLPPEEEDEEEDFRGLNRRLVVELEGELPEDAFSATSDANGRFVFEVAEPGRYVLRVDGGPYLSAPVETAAPATGVRLVVRTGATLKGTVVDARGAPLPLVQLTVELGAGEQRRVVEDTSAVDGTFTLAGLPAGTYTVQAAFDQGGFIHRASRTVTVRDTETVDASLRLDTGLSLSGIVVDEQGQPLEDVEVEAVSLREAQGAPSIRPSSATTGSDGRFTLHHLVEGDCAVRASKQGYSLQETQGNVRFLHTSGVPARAGSQDVRLVMRYQGRILGRVVRADGTPIPRFSINGESYREPEGAFSIDVGSAGTLRLVFEAPGLTRMVRDVTVPEGQDVDLGDVRLEAGRQVRGRVVDGETGAPVPGAEVKVALASEDDWSLEHMPLAEVRTAADGTFALPPLEPRPMQLLVMHEGHAPTRQPLVPEDQTLEVRLYAGARLEGVVRDRQGRPVPAEVQLVPLDRPEQSLDRPMSFVYLHRHGIDAEAPEGRFVVKKLEAGEYAVRVRASSREDGAPRFLARRVRLAPAVRMRLDFDEVVGASTLRLRLKLNLQKPVYDYTVSLVPGSAPATLPFRDWVTLARDLGMPQGDAFYGMEPAYEGLPGGHYTLLILAEVDRNQFQLHREELDVPEGGELFHEVNAVWRPVPPGP